MQAFAELKSLVFQLYEKESSGGLFDFTKHLYSHEDGVLLIGSDPDDRYEGYEAIIHFYEATGAVWFGNPEGTDLPFKTIELNAMISEQASIVKAPNQG